MSNPVFKLEFDLSFPFGSFVVRRKAVTELAPHTVMCCERSPRAKQTVYALTGSGGGAVDLCLEDGRFTSCLGHPCVEVGRTLKPTLVLVVLGRHFGSSEKEVKLYISKRHLPFKLRCF